MKTHRKCPECRYTSYESDFELVDEPEPYIPPERIPGQPLSWHEQEIENGKIALNRIKQLRNELGYSLKDAMDLVRKEGLIK